jgi:hypothetical protein
VKEVDRTRHDKVNVVVHGFITTPLSIRVTFLPFSPFRKDSTGIGWREKREEGREGRGGNLFL